MSATVRVVLSWLVIAAAFVCIPLGYGPWFLIPALALWHVLRSVLKPRIPTVQQRAHPIRSLSLLIAVLVGVVIVRLFFRESPAFHIVNWLMFVPLILYFVYDDIRVARYLTQNDRDQDAREAH